MIPLPTILAALSVPAVGAVLASIWMFSGETEESVPTVVKKKKGKNGRYMAVIACAGPSASPAVHRFEGIADCRVVHSLYSGDRGCKDACLGYGTCRNVCPTHAISLDASGRPRVREDYCDGCGLCVAECPSGVISLVPKESDYVIRCSSRAAPDERRFLCASPCTACGICEQLGRAEGFSVTKSLARIDYAKRADDRSKIARECPTGCITPATDDEAKKNAFQGTDNGIEWSDRGSGAADATK